VFPVPDEVHPVTPTAFINGHFVLPFWVFLSPVGLLSASVAGTAPGKEASNTLDPVAGDERACHTRDTPANRTERHARTKLFSGLGKTPLAETAEPV
jgi:hypothetical protein